MSRKTISVDLIAYETLCRARRHPTDDQNESLMDRQIYRTLRRRGGLIGANDLRIAASAMQYRALIRNPESRGFWPHPGSQGMDTYA